MTNFLCARHILIFIFALNFIACSTNQPQYVDSRDFVSFGLDNHDIGDIIKKQVDSLLKQKIIKNQSEAQILTIGAIDNESGESIDTEIIASELTRYLSNSEKFVVVNAGRDKKIEQILRDSRKMRENAEYNQYTTIEQGNLIAPSYALTGKITKRNRKILDDEIIEYVFSFTLTDLKLGAVRWVGNEQIAKKLPKREVKNFSVAESRNVETNKGESGVDLSDKNKIDLVESSVDSRKNHFIFGFDLGIMNVGFSGIEPMNIDVGGKGYVIKPSDTYGELTFPLNVRVGYLRDIGNWGIAVNALYGLAYAPVRNWVISGDWNSDLNISTFVLLQRVGGEVVFYYTTSNESIRSFFKNTSAYFGVNVYVDMGSKLGGKISVTNENGANIVKLRDRINGFYLGIKGGLVWYFHKNMGMTYELNWQFSLPTNGGSSFNTGFGWAVFGLQWRI